VLSAVRNQEVVPQATVHLGPTLVFGKLWEQLGLPEILRRYLTERKFGLPLANSEFRIIRLSFRTHDGEST
jgi:hypothetical protein